METSIYTHIQLTAAEGCKLTQAADVAPADRVIATTLFLAAGDSPDNWREISDDEAANLEAQRLEALAAPSSDI